MDCCLNLGFQGQLTDEDKTPRSSHQLNCMIDEDFLLKQTKNWRNFLN